MFEIIGCYDSKYDILSSVHIQKIEQSPPKIGSSGYIQTIDRIEDIDDCIARFMALIGYSGLFDLELKYCPNRKEYFYIETNFRAGAPILLSLYFISRVSRL